MKKGNNNDRQEGEIFLVLVPHRDARLMLRKYSGDLFKAGFTGAYQFPWAAPLAVLSRPLNNDELKQFALSVREAAGGGKINAVEAARTAFPPNGDSALFGLRLDLTIPQAAPDEKAAGFFSPPVIGACLLPAETDIDLPPPPELSFRAAAVANMFWRPLRATADGTSRVIGYKWKIGNLRWLPAVRKKA